MPRGEQSLSSVARIVKAPFEPCCACEWPSLELLSTDRTSGFVLLNCVYKPHMRVTSREWLLSVTCYQKWCTRLRAPPRRAGPPRVWKDGRSPVGSHLCPPSWRLPAESCQGMILGKRGRGGHFHMFSCNSSCRVVWQLPKVATRWLEHLGKASTEGEAWQGSCLQWGCGLVGRSRSLNGEMLLVVAVLWTEHFLLYLLQPISKVLYPFYKDIWVPTFQSSGSIDIYLQGDCLLENEAWVLWNPVISVGAGKDVGAGVGGITHKLVEALGHESQSCALETWGGDCAGGGLLTWQPFTGVETFWSRGPPTQVTGLGGFG